VAEKKLKDILSYRHPDYDENINLWNLLADSRSGKGGFLPPLDEPKWGKVTPYWNTDIGPSYVIPFTREKQNHYQQRVRSTSYVNHFRRIEDTILGFMKRSPITIVDLPPELEIWRQNADGLGHSLDDLINGPIASDMLTYGYSFATADRPDIIVPNAAEAQKVMSYVNVRDIRSAIAWNTSEQTNQLEWIRFEEEFSRWLDPMAEPDIGTRWTIWTAEEVQCYEWIEFGPNKTKDAVMVQGFPQPNPIKELPLAIGYYSGIQSYFSIPESPLQSTALLGIYLFNRSSEETDLFRQRGYPLLAWPIKNGKKPANIEGGNHTVLPFDSEGAAPQYLSPDGSTAGGYDVLIKRGEAQIYEQSRTDFSRSGAQVESGVSRAIRFQSMNSNLVSFGHALCDVARQLCSLALKWNSPSPETTNVDDILAETKFESPANYDVKELDRELAQMETGLTLKLGAIADAAIRKQARDLLVTLDPTQLEDSNKEIDGEAAVKRNAENAGEEQPPDEHLI